MPDGLTCCQKIPEKTRRAANQGIIILLLVVFMTPLVSGQEKVQLTAIDSSFLLHSPQKATLYSASLPGLGQVYNHHAWKTPLVYAGFVTIGYFINFNNKAYNKFKKSYLYRTDGDSTTVDPYYPASLYPFVSDQSIKGAMETFRRWRDMNIIGFAGLYLLQIIDANVDAYFYHFDISKDLTMTISPRLQPNLMCPGYNAGLTCLITFKP